MPTYGYECTTCKNQIEVFQSIKDPPLSTCEACGGTLRKRIYPVGISFKGSGFYVNDYGNKPETSKSENNGGISEMKADTPKTDTPKAETAKTETAKTEAPKTETKAPAAT